MRVVWERMRLFRPRYLAVAFAAYFGVVVYYAWQYARRTNAAWFSPQISQVVYQTTMVGGVLVLLGLFVTAAIVPRMLRAAPPSKLAASRQSVRGHRGTGRNASPETADRRTPGPARTEWESVDDFFRDTLEGEHSGYDDIDRVQDAAAISAALSRLVPSGESAPVGTLAERLSGIRARSSAVLVSEGRETAAALLRLVNEMKPLLLAAKKAGLDLPELKKFLSDAAAGRETDLSQRVRLVEQVKGTLEAALVERVAEELQGVLVDIERTKAATQQVHAAEMAAAEAVALLDTGNYAAALDRAAKARETFETQVGTIPASLEGISGPSSFVALAGPSLVAVAFVALSSMLLPAVGGFLVTTDYQLNTGVILSISYSWLGLILYALLSVYLVLRPPLARGSSKARTDRGR